MRALVTGLLAAAIGAGTALAQTSEDCGTAADLAHPLAALPRAGAAVAKDHRLDVVVIGTMSSTLPGPDGARTAYPARLEVALGERLPGVKSRVVNEARPRQSAAEMLNSFNKLIASNRPVMVIWQTGTVDAMRRIDPEEYRLTLEQGIEILQAAGADVVLMNMQYSPRTESMIAADVYADQMRAVAVQQEAPLFDRFDIMKQWSDLGVFDLYSTTKEPATAERVHDCIGQLLADFVTEGVKLNTAGPGETPKQ